MEKRPTKSGIEQGLPAQAASSPREDIPGKKVAGGSTLWTDPLLDYSSPAQSITAEFPTGNGSISGVVIRTSSCFLAT